MNVKVKIEHDIKIDGNKCDTDCMYYIKFEPMAICRLFEKNIRHKRRCNNCLESEIIEDK